MKKRYYIFAMVALAAALSVTGCRKREKIDVTGIHSNEDTTADPGTETMAGNTDSETGAEAPETTADSKADADDGKGTDSASALSVRSKIATAKDGKTSIEYPILSNLRDSNTEEAVNALIKENATRILTDYDLDPSADTLAVSCNIVSLDRSKAVMTYEGSLMVSGAAHPVNIFYTITVDLNKGTLLGLSDYADAYTMAGYMVSDDCVVTKPSDYSAEVKEYLKSQEVNDLWAILKECDFTSKTEGFPQAFSYESQGSVYMAVPVPHALGDYAVVRFDPDTK